MNQKTKIFANGLQRILSILYPLKCPVCDRLIGGSILTCCEECEKKLPYIKSPRCFQCGKPVATEETEYCMDCTRRSHLYTQGLGLWSYNATVRNAVYRFKYKNRREYSVYFGREIVRRYFHQVKNWQAQAILPVPLHKKRYRKRGFNQAELLAREIGAYIQLPVYTDLIVRTKNTMPQKELNDKERQKNLKNAFKISQNSVKLKKVILVDDIYTTGATVDIITQKLLETGITDVYVISLCIGKGY